LSSPLNEARRLQGREGRALLRLLDDVIRAE